MKNIMNVIRQNPKGIAKKALIGLGLVLGSALIYKGVSKKKDDDQADAPADETVVDDSYGTESEVVEEQPEEKTEQPE